ncbi:MAG: hypothetical protein MUE30_11550 [Spirosomaceae bacterium]|nr:hypothetical protein [Spirosomataceae bacterium]
MMKNLIILLLLSSVTFAQKSKTFDLSTLQKEGKLVVVNREIKTITENNHNFIKLEDKEGEGLVWLPEKNFKNGEITVWMRGKDVLQRSFIGLIFHGIDDKTYDAVYCRPFNFFAKDSVRKIHAIQYIAHPDFTWKKLRETRNGEFEKEIVNPPDPNGWFKMRLVIRYKTVEGYINDAAKPSLTVEKLNDRHDGKVGLFVGDGAGGDFEKVTIKFFD